MINVTQVIQQINEHRVTDYMDGVASYLRNFLHNELKHDDEHDYIPSQRQDITLIRVFEKHPHILKLISAVLENSYVITFPDTILNDCFTILQYIFILSMKKDQVFSSQVSITSQAFALKHWQSTAIRFCLNQFQLVDYLPVMSSSNSQPEKSIFLNMIINQIHFMNFDNLDKEDIEQFDAICATILSNYPLMGAHKESISSFIKSYIQHKNYTFSMDSTLMKSLLTSIGSVRIFDSLLNASEKAVFCAANEHLYSFEWKSLLNDVFNDPLGHSIDYQKYSYNKNMLSQSRIEMLTEYYINDLISWITARKQYQFMYKQSKNESILDQYSLLTARVLSHVAHHMSQQFHRFCNIQPEFFKKLFLLSPSNDELPAIVNTLLQIIAQSSDADKEQIWFHLQCFPWIEIRCTQIVIDVIDEIAQKGLSKDVTKIDNPNYLNALQLIIFFNLKIIDPSWNNFIQSQDIVTKLTGTFHHLPRIFEG
jgi:hypothetical protein